jgi:flagellar L-ring protein precursor FlgH
MMTPRKFDAGRVAALAIVVILLGGCDSVPRRDPEFAAAFPAAHPSPTAQQAASGAIYQAGYDIAYLEDIKAHRVGDILTVRLAEANNASKSNDSAISKKQESTVENPTILGTTPVFGMPGILPLAATSGNTLESNLASDHDFAGKSSAKQSNSLSGSISVTVAEVLPNGNLFVRGEKRLHLNQGNEYIKIAGVVRPIDIATDNSVLSTKVADATIIYNGDGAGADANRAGWLSRFFLSAVFPF